MEIQTDRQNTILESSIFRECEINYKGDDEHYNFYRY